MTDVLITPGSRKIEFFNSGDSIDATISTDADGNLSIQNPGGDIAIGDVTGDVYVGDGVNNVNLVFEQDGIIYATTGRTLTIGASGASTVITGSNVSITGTVDFDSAHFDDNKKLYFGTGNDLQIYHDGSNSIIRDAGTGNLDIWGANVGILSGPGTETMAYFATNGAVSLYYDNVKKIETTTSGAEITGDNLENAELVVNGKGGSGSYSRVYVYNDSDGAGHPGAIAELRSTGWGNAYLRIANNYLRQTSGRFQIDHAQNVYFNATAGHNVGIKTSSPSYDLHVNGTLGVEDSATINGITTIYNGSSGYNNWNANSSIKVENSGNTYMEFHTPSTGYAGMLMTDNTAAAGQIIFTHNGTGTANVMHIQAYEDIYLRASQTNGILNGTVRLAVQGSTGRIGIGTTNPNVSLDVSSKTDALGLPKGTTAERPASPVAGQFRYNTETSGAEIYNGTTWGAVGGGGGVTAKRAIAYSIVYGRL